MSAAQFDAAIANVKALTQAAIAKEAKAKNAEIMATEPVPLGFVRHVDGVKDAPEEAVKPGGVIVYDYDRFDLIAEFALDTLRELSPVRTGNYVRAHQLFLNGQPVDDAKGWKPGDEIAIANTEPYARKIEIGGKKFRTHPHVYERATVMVNRRFGNIAHIAFGYMEVDIGDIAEWAVKTHSGAHRKKDHDTWLRRQPALFIQAL